MIAFQLDPVYKNGNFRKGYCTPHAGKQKKDHPCKRRIYPERLYKVKKAHNA